MIEALVIPVCVVLIGLFGAVYFFARARAHNRKVKACARLLEDLGSGRDLDECRARRVEIERWWPSTQSSQKDIEAYNRVHGIKSDGEICD